MKPVPEYEEAAKKYDPDHRECEACLCLDCIYFYHNGMGGDCLEACFECDKKSHISGCGPFDPLED